MQTILVTGANGQVGNEFRLLADQYPAYCFLFVGKDEMPINDFPLVANYFSINKIDVCINCAAYTAVDKAEAEADKAFLINADAAGNLATVCKASGSQLIHISTDYVFDGKTDKPYTEDDKTNTINVYGASKLKGEQLVLQNDPSAIIVRTSWVYSSFGNNFVKTMLRLMKERDSVKVVNDQQGCPTYAADLAKAVMRVVEESQKSKIKNQNRIFNYSNKGVISWYEFAVAIKELTHSTCIVHPVPTSGYPTASMRPEYTALDTTKIKTTFGIEIPYWRDSLEECLKLKMKN
jgi:dTDP-4-dehydrorhamnose reductase